MIKTLRSVDVSNVITGLPITLFSAEPSIQSWTYWRVSILSQQTNTNSNKWFQVKEARVSITIVSSHSDELTINEEENIDSILHTIKNSIVDEWCSKITSYGNITALYCLEGDCTTMLYTVWDRAYKIQDFIIWYESND
jgi:hypothetical protein